MPSQSRSSLLLTALLFALPVVSIGCHGGKAAPGAMPPVAVETVTLGAAPIERTTEYIATLKSRRSSTLQPMVEGFVTRIAVKSGDKVRAGDPILDIDANRQHASVAGLRSIVEARKATVAQAQREAERQQGLFKAGASSAQEAEQAQTELETAQAQLHAVEEQVKEQAVELGYYRVSAPTAGVVGDVPVRIGDMVTRSTTLTTIDSGGGLEVYISVPVRRSSDLAVGLPVRILDDAGAVQVETVLDFVSPQVEESTQTVLAKAPLPNNTRFRTEQQVRARILWSQEPGLRIPVVAVSRVGGRFFAFVAEDAEGKTVARQKGVEVGDIVGNDYVLISGLAPGDRLIVSGVQKIRDGAPVDAKPQAAAPEQG